MTHSARTNRRPVNAGRWVALRLTAPRPEEGEVFVFPRYNWWNNIIGIKGIDRDQRLITLGKDASYAIRPGDRYYVENLFEELDAPGEWYLDGREHALYFWPPSLLTGVPMTPTSGVMSPSPSPTR